MTASAEEFDDLLPETRRALLHRLAVAQVEGRTPSLVGAVVREGRTVWTGARAAEDPPPDADTQYRIGSLTKTFAAVLVLRLRDEGLLDLADPLGRHLPALDQAADATVAQLLAHAAGLSSEARGPWWERTPGTVRPELGDVFGEPPLVHPAGRRHHYSNPGYALLGALVERLRGAPWGEVLDREVLRPLGMTRTSLRPEPPHARGWAVHPWADLRQPEPAVDTGRMAAAGQLWSTAADLARWATFLLDGDERVLAGDTLAEMRRPAVAPEPNPADWDEGYGLGLKLVSRNGRALYGHTGSMPGFLAALWVSREERLAALTLTNSTSGLAIGGLAADLLETVADREPRIPEPWRPCSEPDQDLVALTGLWHWGVTPSVLRLRAGRDLELAPVEGRGRGSRFRPEADGTWTGLDGYHAGETLRVVRDADGRVDHLDLGTFVFTREPYEPGRAVPGGVDPEGWRS